MTQYTRNAQPTGATRGPGPSEPSPESSSTVDQATKGVRRMVETGKNRAADELDSFGRATEAASQQLDHDSDSRVAKYAHTLEDQCHRASSYLRQASPQQLADDAAEITRDHPVLTLGTAAVAGIALGRLISATRPSPPSRSTHRSEPGRESTPNVGGFGAGTPGAAGGVLSTPSPTSSHGAAPGAAGHPTTQGHATTQEGGATS